MTWLKEAIAKCYIDTANMAKDKDLDALRNRDYFKKLMAEIEGARPTGKVAMQRKPRAPGLAVQANIYITLGSQMKMPVS